MKRLFAVGAIGTLFFMAGCIRVATPAQLSRGLDRVYDGQQINRFFDDYGQPSGAFVLGDGSRVYRWTSLPPPSVTPPLALYRSATSQYMLADNYRGRIATHYCELRIAADADDSIQDFRIAIDSMGQWSESYCEEIFQL